MKISCVAGNILLVYFITANQRIIGRIREHRFRVSFEVYMTYLGKEHFLLFKKGNNTIKMPSCIGINRQTVLLHNSGIDLVKRELQNHRVYREDYLRETGVAFNTNFFSNQLCLVFGAIEKRENKYIIYGIINLHQE